MIQFKVYPTLLNQFARFQKGFTSNQELLDKVNRVPAITTEAQVKGISFEETIVKGINEEAYHPNVIDRVLELLPNPIVDTQVYCEVPIDNCLVYGFVDLLGLKMAVDLKTTKSYSKDKFSVDHQNFYLLALHKKFGIETLRYLITDFSEVFYEDYSLKTLDTSLQREQIKEFWKWLNENRPYITDSKIFNV